MRLRYLEDVVAVANVFAEDLLRHWLFNFFRLLRNGRAISQDAAPEEGGRLASQKTRTAEAQAAPLTFFSGCSALKTLVLALYLHQCLIQAAPRPPETRETVQNES